MPIIITQPSTGGIMEAFSAAGSDMLAALANCTATLSGNPVRGQFLRRSVNPWATEDLNVGGTERVTLRVLIADAGAGVTRGTAVPIAFDDGTSSTWHISDSERTRELGHLLLILEA